MRLPLLLVLLACGGWLRADVSLAPLFQDHVVLQRDKPVPVWGWAEAGEAVTITFAGQEVKTVADAAGRWRAVLAPLAASAEPAELVAAGRNRVVVRDVVVGEVWLCSGQSNMAWTVAASDRPQEEKAAARFPLIRHYKVPLRVADAAEERMKGEWQVASPETVGNFTGVGYFFARELHRKLGVPIGLVNSSYGGTPVEAWMSPGALASDPAFAVVAQRWSEALAKHPERAAAHREAMARWTADRDAAKAAGKPFDRRAPRPPQGPGHPDTPSGLYHAMIHPVLPYALRGALWYQGESNAGRASEYRALFSAMITQWREAFGQGDFPFYWVQLANFKTDQPDSGAWPRLREAQTQTLALPATGQAVTIDIGDPDDIHPRNKQEVGRRLALIALTQTYGQTADHSGPVFVRADPEKGRLRVVFAHAVTGLIAREKPLSSFEVAGADGVYRPATAEIDGDTVLVRADDVPAPVAVRYAWSNSPEANLFNGAGLPAVPFRSDAR